MLDICSMIPVIWQWKIAVACSFECLHFSYTHVEDSVQTCRSDGLAPGEGEMVVGIQGTLTALLGPWSARFRRCIDIHDFLWQLTGEVHGVGSLGRQ